MFVVLADASWWKRIFGSTKEDSHVQTITQDLIEAREHAFNAWQEARKAAVDLSDAAWEAMVDTYETSWTKYREAKEKLFQGAESALETAIKDYKIARDAAVSAAKTIAEYLSKYKDKAEDRLSETFFSGLQKLEDTAGIAKKKFVSSRDTLSGLYERAYDEAVDDLQASAQYFSDASDRLKKFVEQKSSDPKAAQTKKKLEEARDKARLAYRAAKKRVQESKGKLDQFYSELSQHMEDSYNAAKMRADEDVEFLKRFKDDAKWKANKNYQKWESSLQVVSDRVNHDLKDVEAEIAVIKEKVSKWGTDALENIRLQFLNLKDEL
jgi:hypothetical protein